LSGGVEILLEPGWHTYWRNPGDAGVSPSFDFLRSENVSTLEVLYPAPERTTMARAYRLFIAMRLSSRIAVTPADRGRPCASSFRQASGVCREICIRRAPART
jgi:DsbC/DsbD-like thiol-disulfide interchange protein